MDSAKNLLLIGLSKKKPDHVSEGADENEGAAEKSPSDEAIEEMFREWKAGNHDGAKEAFRSAVNICVMEHAKKATDDDAY